MGVVYRALDTKLNRPVAVKFLSPDVATEQARRRFQREAQLASALNHPHILTVHDAGDWNGQQFVVTESVDGGTLTSWAAESPRSWRQCVELLTAVAEGLAAAHEAHILHRDIKPGNILVSQNGYAKLADFGLARLEGNTATDGTRTQSGTIVGTWPTCPRSRPWDASATREDIFSLGVVLYEMLSGRRPFEGGSSLDVLQKIVQQTPTPLPIRYPARCVILSRKPSRRNRPTVINRCGRWWWICAVSHAVCNPRAWPVFRLLLRTRIANAGGGFRLQLYLPSRSWRLPSVPREGDSWQQPRFAEATD